MERTGNEPVTLRLAKPEERRNWLVRVVEGEPP
jgi:hypothetical protein